MQEQTIREVLHTAADAAELPSRFLHPSHVVRSSRTRAWWRRPAVAAAAAFAVCALSLLAAPGGRALAEKLALSVVTLWSGQVSGVPAQVNWIPPEAHGESIDVPGKDYLTFDEAAAAAGIRPAEANFPGAELGAVHVQVLDMSQDNRFVVAFARYGVTGLQGEGWTQVTVSTEANLRKAGDTWQVLPYTQLVTGDGQYYPMENIRTLKLGSTEAVAYDQRIAGATYTWISWLQNGIKVRVNGKDPALVEAVANATVR